MKICKDCQELKPLSEYTKESNNPDGLVRYCTPCRKLRRKASYSKHRDSHLQRTKKWRKENQDHLLAYYKVYREANKPRRAAQQNKRRLIQDRATVRDDDSILLAYAACDLLNQVTGEWHEVDHIVPLINEKVCGLHVGINLQILTKEENRKKGNKFIP